jgi:uroporphyrinogen III methyltransferase/synthase
VVRLQGGDPGLFGHLGEELEFLDAWNIRSDVVTAPTAAQVLAAHGGAALTHRRRGRSVTFLSGHAAAGAETVRYPGPQEGNLALYMPVTNRAEITRNLRNAGWPDDAPILVGQRLGSRDETISRLVLRELPAIEVAPPAVMLIGPEIRGRTRTTLFVGTNPDHFLNHGPLIHWPLIKLVATPLRERARLLTERLHEFDGLLFPSRFAVPCLVDGLHAAGLDVRALAGKKLLAVGPATARELKAVGLVADLAADSLGGVRDLVQKLTDAYRGRYLYPCSDASPAEQRTAAMRPHGIELEPVVFYRNRPMPFRNLPNTPFDRVLFTSSSTAREYFTHYPDETKATRTWVAVGPSTLEYLESMGLQAELLQANPLRTEK